MAQQNVAGLAALIVLGFVIVALSACAVSGQAAPANAAAIGEMNTETPATPEFHDASIGRDALRSRL